MLQAEVWWERSRQMLMNNVPVFVTVTAATKGGLVVQYDHVKGFIPVSQLGPVSATAVGGGGVEPVV
jgi:ribosomal protein S1